MRARFSFLLILLVAIFTSAAHANDWFVRAGSDGDGSKEKPFKDPYLALEKAEAGDAIHIATGVYYGKLDIGNWSVAVPRLKLIGGYNADFTQRDPWKNPTQFNFKKENTKARNTGTLLRGDLDHSGLVVDGFIFDQQDRNAYNEGEYGDLQVSRSAREPILLFTSPNVEVRNCLILNGASIGVQLSGEASKFENNTVMNIAGAYMLEINVANQAKATVIKNNTFLFAWAPVFGKGGPDGIGIKLWSGCKAEVLNNVFQNCDNHGVFIDTKPDRVTLKNNRFWLNSYSNIKFYIEGRDVALDNSNMGEIDDVGLKAVEGNEAEDPQLGGLDPKWMERYINRTASERGKVKMDDWNKFRQLVGAPLTAEGGKGPTGFAMAYKLEWARKLQSKVPNIGAHPVKLDIAYTSTGPVAAATKIYEPSNWETLLKNPASIDKKNVEINGAFGSQKSWYPIAGISDKEYVGVELWDIKEQQGLPPVIYIKRGTNAEKVLNEAQSWGGNGEPTDKFIFRGVVKYDETSTARFKGTLLVDSIAPYSKKIDDKKRPVGRDWFVRAGSSGNGTKEKPFKDPWQALEKCTPGDVIHVAEGEYFGKLKVGYWTIDVRNIAMLGGYSADFSERNPWTHPTRLGYAKDSKAWTDGSYIRGEDNHSNFIFDGFVLDGSDVNKYNTDGDLMFDRSTRHALIEVKSDGVEVRNCVLVNGSLGSITYTGNGGVIENNIILNYHWHSVVLTPGRNDIPYLIRNNTMMFTWYDRASAQSGQAVGSTFYTRGDVQFELDNNIIAFSDSCGAFSTSAPKFVKLTNNVFTKNLFAHYSNDRNIILDDQTITSQIKDAGFIASDGNTTSVDPQLPLDPKWMGVYIKRTMVIPGKVKQDDWNKLRDLLGVNQVAEGGVAATGYARVYDWKQAIKLFPKNAACKAGARPVAIAVKFNPNPPPPPEPEKEYAAVDWTVLQNKVDTIDGKAVEFEGYFADMNVNYFVPDLKQADGWVTFNIMGPNKADSGLPITGFYKKDTRTERQVKKADRNVKYKIRGTARKPENFSRGCLIVESLEKAD